MNFTFAFSGRVLFNSDESNTILFVIRERTRKKVWWKNNKKRKCMKDVAQSRPLVNLLFTVRSYSWKEKCCLRLFVLLRSPSPTHRFLLLYLTTRQTVLVRERERERESSGTTPRKTSNVFLNSFSCRYARGISRRDRFIPVALTQPTSRTHLRDRGKFKMSGGQREIRETPQTDGRLGTQKWVYEIFFVNSNCTCFFSLFPLQNTSELVLTFAGVFMKTRN